MNFTFNIAKGRAVELYNRVKSNDPANAALVVVILAAAGIEADAVLMDKDTLTDVLAGATNEATNAGYARKVLTDVELAAFPAPDDVNDKFAIDIPDQEWLAVAAVGGAWAKALICYDPDTAAGTDANIIPLTAHDFPITPDGSDVMLRVDPVGFFTAT